MLRLGLITELWNDYLLYFPCNIGSVEQTRVLFTYMFEWFAVTASEIEVGTFFLILVVAIV